jgi:hypothetical protein
MRQVMPHRNNIAMRRTKSKIFFAGDEVPRVGSIGKQRKLMR